MAKVAIVGCGAMGSVYAALMVDAGHEVHAVDLLPDHVAAMQAAREHKWHWQRIALVLVASVLPAGPFVVEAKILRETADKKS